MRTSSRSAGWATGVSAARSARPEDPASLKRFELRLTGELAAKYDLEYRVNVQGPGGCVWVENGAAAGTVGKARRVEAIRFAAGEDESLSFCGRTAPTSGARLVSSVDDGAIERYDRKGRCDSKACTANVNGSKYSGDVTTRTCSGHRLDELAERRSSRSEPGHSRRLEAFEIKLRRPRRPSSVRYSRTYRASDGSLRRQRADGGPRDRATGRGRQDQSGGRHVLNERFSASR